MDTEMGEAVYVSAAPVFEPPGSANGVINHIATSDMSRELSLPTKVTGQLNLGSSSPEDEDDFGVSAENAIILQQSARPRSSLRTGLCYDPRMRFHTELNPPTLRSDFHPEDPRRILAIYQVICFSGLFEDPVFRPTVAMVENPLLRIPSRHATKEEVLLVHQPKHFTFLYGTASKYSHKIT